MYMFNRGVSNNRLDADLTPDFQKLAAGLMGRMSEIETKQTLRFFI